MDRMGRVMNVLVEAIVFAASRVQLGKNQATKTLLAEVT